MSYRDTLPFKAIGALTLSVELLFFKASWPRVPSIIFEVVRFLVLIAVMFNLAIFFANTLGGYVSSLHLIGDTIIALFYLCTPVYSPIFCFFRPTTKQFRELKDELRLVCSYSERAKFSDMYLYVVWFIGAIVLRAKYSGHYHAAADFLIVAPFVWMSFIHSRRRYNLAVRSNTLAQIMSPPAGVGLSNVGSWSDSFVHSYLYDLLFFLALISSQICNLNNQ